MQAPDPTTKLGKGFAIIAWLMLLGVIYLFFDDYLQAQFNPNQQLRSAVGVGGERTVLLTANRQGHYVGTLKLNGQDVDFLLDTGATMVAVSSR